MLTATDFIEIQNLVYRYCAFIDKGELGAMADMFAYAEFTVPAGRYVRDPRGIEAMYRQYVRLYQDGTPRTRHVTTNLIVDPYDELHAFASSSVIVFQQTDELPLQAILGSRNADQFEKVDGLWRFSARDISVDLLGNVSAHMLKAI